MLEAIKGHYKNGKVELYEKPHLNESEVIITFLSSEGREEGSRITGTEDPVLRLQGLGKDIWKGIDPDSYVRGLREGWE